MCTHTQQCLQKKETNEHAVVECGRYATARQQFALETGITITPANYVDVMALNAKKFNIAPDTLSTALCRLLAHIMKKHRKENNNNASNIAVANNIARAPLVVPTPHMNVATHTTSYR